MATDHIEAVITGAGGWLGRALVGLMTGEDLGVAESPGGAGRLRLLLAPGEPAPAFARLGERAEIVVGDVRDAAAMARLLDGAEGAVLHHTVGVIHPARVADFYDVNVRGTLTVLQAAQRAGVRRAVVVSSNSPIGCNPTPDHVFDEDSPFNPYMHYGRSKMQMEQAVMQLQQDTGLPTVRVRAPWFYGPFQPARQTLFFRMIRDGRAPLVGDGTNMRSMAYVGNLALGLLRAADAPAAPGRVYWIADERPYSMNEIIATVEQVLEQDFRIQCRHGRLRLPGLASDVAYWCDRALQGLGVYHQKIHVLSEMNKTIACSVARARAELGYEPPVALREGMRRSVEWLLRHDARALEAAA